MEEMKNQKMIDGGGVPPYEDDAWVKELHEEITPLIMGFEIQKRDQLAITLAGGVLKALNRIREDIVFEDGSKYPLSHLIEDVLLWVLADPQRFSQFLDDMYEEVDEDEGVEDNG